MLEFDPQSFYYLGGVPIVIGLVQALKFIIPNTKWSPLFAIVIGIILDVIIGALINAPPIQSIIVGILAGLSAAGIYSGTAKQLDNNSKEESK